jgi:hypothetical protein
MLKRSKTPPGKDLLLPQHPHPGMFHQAHNLSATGNFIDGNVGSGEKYSFCDQSPKFEQCLQSR